MDECFYSMTRKELLVELEDKIDWIRTLMCYKERSSQLKKENEELIKQIYRLKKNKCFLCCCRN